MLRFIKQIISAVKQVESLRQEVGAYRLENVSLRRDIADLHYAHAPQMEAVNTWMEKNAQKIIDDWIEGNDWSYLVQDAVEEMDLRGPISEVVESQDIDEEIERMVEHYFTNGDGMSELRDAIQERMTIELSWSH